MVGTHPNSGQDTDSQIAAKESLTKEEKVWLRNSIEQVKEKIEEGLNGPIFESNAGLRDACKNTIASYLDELKSKGVVPNYKVGEAETVHHTWTSLYPKLSDRVLAFIFGRLLKRTFDSQQKWYHTIAPYKIENSVSAPAVVDCRDGTEVFEDIHWYYDRLISGGISYSARLVMPYTETVIPWSFTPVAPVSHIHLSVTVTKEGATFNEVIQ